MKNSYKFFENKSCYAYPCHKGLKEINCLFCFCPGFHICQDRKVGKQKCEDCTFHINEKIIK